MKVALCLCLLYAVALCDEVKSKSKTVPEVYNQNNPLGLKQNNVFYNNLGVTIDLYASDKEIRNILVSPSEIAMDIYNLFMSDDDSHPSVYFNLYENGKNDGIYLLKNKTATKISDGTDSTTDYPSGEINADNIVIYITSSDGIHTYNPKTEALLKFGNITEEFKAIDKVSNQDEIYVLAADNNIYKITEQGTIKTKVNGIDYAKDFVLDFHGSIYFLGEDNKPQVLHKGSTTPVKIPGLNFDVKNPILGRPIWWDSRILAAPEPRSLPFISDGVLFKLENDRAIVATCDATVAGLTAFSAEYSFVNFYGENGHIYMYSVLSKYSFLIRTRVRV